jgi:hypothetical protein
MKFDIRGSYKKLQVHFDSNKLNITEIYFNERVNVIRITLCLSENTAKDACENSMDSGTD